MTSKVDWRTLCQEEDGDYFNPKHTEYEFSNGRKFSRSKKPFYTEESIYAVRFGGEEVTFGGEEVLM